jgi:DNA-binding PadR family transcriptional regulator
MTSLSFASKENKKLSTRMQHKTLRDGSHAREPDTRQRKYYHITKAGRAALGEKKESWSQLAKAITKIMGKSK